MRSFLIGPVIHCAVMSLGARPHLRVARAYSNLDEAHHRFKGKSTQSDAG
jgi:hypothetical protein